MLLLSTFVCNGGRVKKDQPLLQLSMERWTWMDYAAKKCEPKPHRIHVWEYLPAFGRVLW